MSLCCEFLVGWWTNRLVVCAFCVVFHGRLVLSGLSGVIILGLVLVYANEIPHRTYGHSAHTTRRFHATIVSLNSMRVWW